MKRRTVLRRVGVAGAAGALAGCVADREAIDSEDQPAGDGGESGDESDEESGADDSGTTADDASAPTLGDVSFSGGDGECESEGDDASVAFEDGAVAVDGRISAPDPCHDAESESVEYDAEADELRVAVATAGGGGICQQCTGEIAYGLEAAFSGGLPGRVVVTHDAAGDDSKTVADVRR